MHELSLMENILQAALGEAGKAGAKSIREISARIRESGHPMDAYQLQSLLEELSKGTAAEGAKITIEVIPPTLQCQECNSTFTAEHGTLLCPHCHSSKLKSVDAEEIDLECDFTE